mgnify:CR=1 FL=1
MVPSAVVHGSRLRGIGRLLALGTALVAVAYFIWTPFDVPVRSSGALGSTVAVGVAGCALGVFLSYLLLSRPATGDDGKVVLLVAWIVGAFGLSIVIHGGILGPLEYTGNFLFRLMTVLAALATGHRLGLKGILSPRWAGFVGAAVVLAIAVMMGLAWARGVWVDMYLGQGVTVIGTPGGQGIQAYLLAFSVPLLLLIRNNVLRSALVLLALVAVALTYRRGPFLCAAVPVALLPFFDRRRQSGRRWYLDFLVVVAAGMVAIELVGAHTIFARWEALIEGNRWALSERDVIYATLLSHVFPLQEQIVFGRGIGSTGVILSLAVGRYIFAHNDWLELLVSVGLFGTIPFLLLNLTLLRGVVRGIRTDRYVGFVAAALYVQFFIAGWTEGVLYGAQHGAFLTFFLGWCIAWARRARIAHGKGSLPGFWTGTSRTNHSALGAVT